MNKLLLWPGVLVIFAFPFGRAAGQSGALQGQAGAQQTQFAEPRAAFVAADSGFYDSQLQHAIEVYERFAGEQAGLYNGRQYAPYIYQMEGHPFAVSGDWKQGDVFYDGKRYSQVPVLYDIARNEVVVRAYNSPLRIVLHNELINYFAFPGYRFERMEGDSLSGFPAGFYHTAYDGKVKVLVRMTKEIREEVSESAVNREFISKDYYYLIKDGNYYPADSKRAVLKVFADRKSALKRYLKQQRIYFRKDPGAAIKMMAAHYDQLNNL